MTAWHASAHAYEPTSTGSLLRQNPELIRGAGAEPGLDRAIPAEPSAPVATARDDGELSFPVTAFDFGSALSPEEQQRADAFTTPWRGRNVTISQLHALRDALTAVLYNGGDSLVRVILPPQTVTDGVVHFEIVRGHIESLDVENTSNVVTERLREILHTSRDGQPSLREIERNVRLTEEVPGVASATPTLSAGSEPGGTIVTVDVEPGDRFYGAAAIDNAGSRQAGWRRFGVTGGINNPLGLGDQFQATAYLTPRFMQTKAGEDGHTRLGRVSYDLLTGLGASRAGIAYSRVDYKLGEAFAGLGTGSANVISRYGTNPVIRSGTVSLDVGASLNFKRSSDEKFGDILRTDERSVLASVRVDGTMLGQLDERRNAIQYSAIVSRGTAKQRESDYSGSVAALSGRRFDFYKAEPALAYVQAITPTIRASVQMRGQWASRSLDSSERLGLGGPSAVRAYDQNAASVDDGFVFSVAASKSFSSIPGTSLQIFYDDARGRTRGDGPIPGGSVRLQGYGIGANFSGKRVAAQLSYAMRAGHAPAHTARQQTWVTVSTTF
ncbi:Heme/hemopexin transporter protein HuxB [Paraburkholderia graminis C4D1M]|uniref:Polypeptide-transport-associated domain protein ShlB-type n=1 Tax=Paraburkholderia graminis (strain ATCC 700544 / DSM 17151 / LMG 18924 / NCIMB 13744 / C4D1M) TaxID=396598 RepID=B1FV82_PARG4|nr:ShlB/FhaC/HecB family hemolysin secretion/activation protein [Paraburkholderia graminis]EDT12391.1 Polypeptide-transport-associated domain protein ShlB-type [Paraburkholderia graminis C4D1M]CAB3733217.1 Heme/hemopexin transporter protein HuxB [Paraburkholderia graminis C4D1M]